MPLLAAITYVILKLKSCLKGLTIIKTFNPTFVLRSELCDGAIYVLTLDYSSPLLPHPQFSKGHDVSPKNVKVLCQKSRNIYFVNVSCVSGYI